ncbi:MAG: FHA domain-containing protein [Planctomycetes bacterium]|nr:FHA domain-containing protein [Planctomycetota bacterium]
MQVRLILLSGSRVGEEVRVDDEAVLGRSADCALSLEDNGVSRHHARVRLEDDGSVWIEDLGSSNGTKIAGQRVREAKLEDGDIFELATVKVRVKVSGHESVAPSSADQGAAPPAEPAGTGFEDLEIEEPVVTVRSAPRTDSQPPRPKPAEVVVSSKSITPRVPASRQGNLLAEDLAQQTGLPKLLMVLVAVAAAGGVFWLLFEAVR